VEGFERGSACREEVEVRRDGPHRPVERGRESRHAKADRVASQSCRATKAQQPHAYGSHKPTAGQPFRGRAHTGDDAAEYTSGVDGVADRDGVRVALNIELGCVRGTDDVALDVDGIARAGFGVEANSLDRAGIWTRRSNKRGSYSRREIVGDVAHKLGLRL